MKILQKNDIKIEKNKRKHVKIDRKNGKLKGKVEKNIEFNLERQIEFCFLSP